jgi:hypothetical protein
MTPNEYELKIKDLNPSTTSMARLAMYMSELAKLMGEKEHVHFDRVSEGSVRLISYIDEIAKPKIDQRLADVNKNQETRNAYNAIQKLLGEDKTTAELIADGISILKITGKSEIKPTLYPKELITLRGELIKIGGSDNTIPFTIIEQRTGEKINGNVLGKEMAKDLAKQLYNQIEVVGVGNWTHDRQKDEWKLDDYLVKSFTVLKSIPVLQSIESLYDQSNPNAEDPLKILDELRGEH